MRTASGHLLVRYKATMPNLVPSLSWVHGYIIQMGGKFIETKEDRRSNIGDHYVFNSSDVAAYVANTLRQRARSLGISKSTFNAAAINEKRADNYLPNQI